MSKTALKRLSLMAGALSAALPALADDAASAPAAQEYTQELPEIVVSGERTRRSSFETATGHRVFTTPDIDRSGHNLSATDVLKQTVNTVDLGSGNDLPTVRGVRLGAGCRRGSVFCRHAAAFEPFHRRTFGNL